jgi:hypothetical protein
VPHPGRLLRLTPRLLEAATLCLESRARPNTSQRARRGGSGPHAHRRRAPSSRRGATAGPVGDKSIPPDQALMKLGHTPTVLQPRCVSERTGQLGGWNQQ